MSKHTPGPWRTTTHNDRKIVGADNIKVAVGVVMEGTRNKRTKEEAVSNARLIAKAPEMYDLILQLSRCVVYGEGGTIEVRDWQMLEDVLQGGYAIYQEVEGI